MPKEKETITKDGLFISRRMRRDADATAKAEVEANKLAEEKAADDADRAAYEMNPEYASKSDSEKTFLREKALYQANEDARKANGLETDQERRDREAKEQEAANKKAAADAAAAAKAATKAK